MRSAPIALQSEPLRLNLGCGQAPKDGYVNVDQAAIDTVDLVLDLKSYPWPWADGSVDVVCCENYLEHIDGPERIKFMNELYRVLVDGGEAQIAVPYWTSIRAVQDPSHAWPPWCEASFLYFNRGWREQAKVDHYIGLVCDFDIEYFYEVSNTWGGASKEEQGFAVVHYTNAATDLHVRMVKR